MVTPTPTLQQQLNFALSEQQRLRRQLAAHKAGTELLSSRAFERRTTALETRILAEKRLQEAIKNKEDAAKVKEEIEKRSAAMRRETRRRLAPGAKKQVGVVKTVKVVDKAKAREKELVETQRMIAAAKEKQRIRGLTQDQTKKLNPKQFKRLKLLSDEQVISNFQIQNLNKLNNNQPITPNDARILNKVKLEGTAGKATVAFLKDVPKNIVTGVYEVGKEVVVFARDSVVGAFDYGTGLRKRFEEGEDNPLFNDVKSLALGTKDVAKFVVENPRESLAIVALTAETGGGQFKEAFFENPVKTLTKTVTYLFPGTIAKGGVKLVGTGTKGIQTITQAQKFNSLNKLVSSARVGATTAQNAKLTKALGAASKLAGKAKNKKVASALKSILKDRGVKPFKGATLDDLIKQVAASGKKPIKVIGEPKVPKKSVKKKPKKKVIKKKELKKAEVEVKVVTKTTKKKGRKVITRYKIKKDGSLEKITKKEFDKIKAKQKKAPGKPKKETPARKVDLEDLKKSEAKVFETKPQLADDLAKKGVVKEKGVIYVDVNAVQRIEKSQAVVKPIAKKTFLGNKKAQVRFQTQIQQQVTKTRTKVKAVKKNPTKANVKAIKKELKALKGVIGAADVNNLVRVVGLAKVVTDLIKEVEGIKKIPVKAPVKAPAQKPKKAPAKKPAKTPAKKPVTTPKKATKPKTPTKPKTKTATKTVKKVPKKPKKPAKKVTQKTPVVKIPKRGDPLPKGTRLSFNIRIAGKVFTIKKPLNEALKRATTIVLKDKRLKRFDLLIAGTTKQKDALRPKALDKFKGTLGDRVYTYVQK